jgi:hypothetical protein
MTLGNAMTAKFREYRWIQSHDILEIIPELYACIPNNRHKTRTVFDGLIANQRAQDIHDIIGIHEIGQYLYLWQQSEHT